MLYSTGLRHTGFWLLFLGIVTGSPNLPAESAVWTNINLRVMAANLNGGSQTIEPYAIRIFQGLKPDVVAIQEFNYLNNTPAELRAFVTSAFGENFVYYRESGHAIPNGVISRYPIVASGSWTDVEVSNRGFAWARIDLPGTNDLYVVSVHLLTSNSAERGSEAVNLKALIQSNFPQDAWIVLGGDMNTGSRTEAAINTFSTFLSDSPIPTDAVTGGDPDTNNGREKPYDYVLPSFNLATHLTNTAFASKSFPKGLVFDSRVYSPLSDVTPVLSGDSGNGQHMGVLKDFHIAFTTTSVPGPPEIVMHPQSQSIPLGATATFSVTATGGEPLAYRWRHEGVDLADATLSSYTVNPVQTIHEGGYQVVITNSYGSVTSATAVLTVTLPAPYITRQPQSQAILEGAPVSFSVEAGGWQPLSYQWRSNGVAIPGSNLTNYLIGAMAPSFQGDYSVVITNVYGSVTSTPARLTLSSGSSSGILAGWDMSAVTGFGPSPMAASTNAAQVVVGGLTRAPGLTTNPTAAGRCWGANGFGTASAEAAIDALDYVTFSLATTPGYELSCQAISTLHYRRSSTGPANGLLQYRLGTGPFVDLANLTYPSTTSSGAALPPIDLSNVAALQAVGAGTNITFRLVNYNGAAGGNWYIFDGGNSADPDLAITGTATLGNQPPVRAPVFTNAAWVTPGSFCFTLLGTPGLDYVIEMATNLASAPWIPIATNPAGPSIINPAPGPRGFFRARAAL